MRCPCFLFSHFLYFSFQLYRRTDLCFRLSFCFCFRPSRLFLAVFFAAAAAAVFAFFIDFSQTWWHVSIDVEMFESASPFPFRSSFLLVMLSLLFFGSHACWKVTVNFFELFPAASFTCACVAPLIFLFCCVHLFDCSQSFLHLCVVVPSLDCSQSLQRVFSLPFFHLIFDLSFDVLVFDFLDASTLTCFFTTFWPLTDTCVNIQFMEIELRGMLCFT